MALWGSRVVAPCAAARCSEALAWTKPMGSSSITWSGVGSRCGRDAYIELVCGAYVWWNVTVGEKWGWWDGRGATNRICETPISQRS